MLSVLIPVYNYLVSDLVFELHRQLIRSGVDFEILLLDDASKKEFSLKNNQQLQLNHVSYAIANQNAGRTKTRQILAQQAQYDWLLFLDADVIIKKKDFIASYLEAINHPYDVIYGGFGYEATDNKPDTELRYLFGKKREELDAQTRGKVPYKTITSANILIKKEVFYIVNDLQENFYGLDYYLSVHLKRHHYKIKHLDNKVIHKGLESNLDFINKSKKAVETLSYLKDQQTFVNSDISLLKAYRKLERFKMTSLTSFFFSLSEKLLLKNLCSKNPSLFIFDIYRLGYFCSLNRKN
ncbi:MAG: glycosyltransferase [Flavobacteriaceae bacterium]|nr:glycosyltransferase [Flavobacteriaceae bacterium]